MYLLCMFFRDMCLWPQFVENCPNKDILQERLGGSLAGMACMPMKKGHAVIHVII